MKTNTQFKNPTSTTDSLFGKGLTQGSPTVGWSGSIKRGFHYLWTTPFGCEIFAEKMNEGRTSPRD